MIPTQIPKLNHVIQISAGHEHSACLDKYKEVYIWGCNEGGMLGLGN
jgi:alpha-tubulin suppressor-like RCC1 family protein